MSKIYNSDTHEICFRSEIALLLFKYDRYISQTDPEERTGNSFEEYALGDPYLVADDTAFCGDFWELLEILKKFIDGKYNY